MSGPRLIPLDHKYSNEDILEISQGIEKVLQVAKEWQTCPLEKLVQEQATHYQAYTQSLDVFSAALAERSKMALGMIKKIQTSLQLPYPQMSENLKNLELDQDILLKKIQSENKKQETVIHNAALNGQKTKAIEEAIKIHLTQDTDIIAFNNYINLINSNAAESKRVFISFIPRKQLADQQCGQCVNDLQTLRNEVKRLKPIKLSTSPNAYFRQHSPVDHQADLFVGEEKKKCCCVLL